MTTRTGPKPPGSTRGQRIRLKSLMDIREEMARVYRDMRSESIGISAGNGLTQALLCLAKVTETTQGAGLLERLEELEGQRAATADTGAATPTN